jgi:hypothetical protein
MVPDRSTGLSASALERAGPLLTSAVERGP